MEKFLKSKSAGFVLPFIATVVLFIVWELVVIIFKIPPFNLPAPTNILNALINFAPQLTVNAIRTLWTTMLGFIIAVAVGVVLGFIIGYSRTAYLTLYPLLVAFNTIPKAALVPLLAIWFGANAIPATLTAFLLAFFPIAVNVALGLDTVEPEMKDVLRALGANQVEAFQKIGWPHTLPYIFASLKIAASFAFIGTVISESVASNAGLGFLIVQATSDFNVPLAFAALLILALMGILLYGFFVLVEKKVIYWAR
ncbi:ABC transporter permease [Leptolyngbya boryana CZ1]|jgi:NitT/TauT family transport system permease protein|uniref:ABC transporter permease n=2 Tax=Leptolyngbya boryana TaxID=1184 RepID=A0A1Z4JF00_LEPBY|nr:MULTISPECIES: ABC transporter permease [Leptolyngbya]BAY55342.1 ABC transporter permease [Leptolyngbya boryana NIES-2135]MBD1859998.1 ABC transporter permease [Leptolyngbya sp. FACHB-1624]MBD2368504.1 ABC transporter permease [Leptolyngbya sp. FACHB-161]MBD2374840.1 ABC transporter permease [Leptolyngbya sp. FACHB-238]MBD2399260.1 ABC transporter permease [Leptolyngbya sp. FACHB-239]